VYGDSFNEYDNFYFSGDTEDFNRFLDDYARLEGRPLKLLLRPEQGKTETWNETTILFDWQVGTPQLRLWLYIGGQVELDKVKFPANVKVEPDGLLEKLVADIKAERKQPNRAETTAEPSPPPPVREKREGTKPASAGSTDTAEAAARVVLRSKKPLYAKVALDEDGSKVLSVMYDESEGTGKGYDILYADVNFNGTFEHAERIKKTSHPYMFQHGRLRAGWAGWSFSPIILNVPFNEKGQRVSDPCKITFRYQRYPIPDRVPRLVSVTPPPSAAKVREVFEILSEIRLRQDSTVWEYSFEGNMKPSESVKSAPVWSFDDRPKLQVSTRPDGRKKGNLGIALNVPAGEHRFECKKEGEPPKAHVEIRKLDGTVVHEGDDDLGKFRFG